MKPTALVLIDIQNDYFPGGLKALDGMEAATVNAARLLRAARDQGRLVFHIRHIAASHDAPFFRPGTEGSRINNAVFPMPDETVFEKSRPNSFIGTGLEAALRSGGIEHLILCGAMSQMCVDATAPAATDMGFQITVVSDACAAATATHAGLTVPAEMVHAAIMAPLAASYGRIVTTGDLEKAVSQQ